MNTIPWCFALEAEGGGGVFYCDKSYLVEIISVWCGHLSCTLFSSSLCTVLHDSHIGSQHRYATCPGASPSPRKYYSTHSSLKISQQQLGKKWARCCSHQHSCCFGSSNCHLRVMSSKWQMWSNESSFLVITGPVPSKFSGTLPRWKSKGQPTWDLPNPQSLGKMC